MVNPNQVESFKHDHTPNGSVETGDLLQLEAEVHEQDPILSEFITDAIQRHPNRSDAKWRQGFAAGAILVASVLRRNDEAKLLDQLLDDDRINDADGV